VLTALRQCHIYLAPAARTHYTAYHVYTQGAAQKAKPVTPVVGGLVGQRPKTKKGPPGSDCHLLDVLSVCGVFELLSPRNAQKRDKQIDFFVKTFFKTFFVVLLNSNR
jgi:hypothetical protein